MKYTLKLSERAVVEFEESYHYYESKVINLGDRFQQELLVQFMRIEKNPNQFQRIDHGFRVCRVKTFPFLIIFKVYEADVLIYSIFHSRRDPKKMI